MDKVIVSLISVVVGWLLAQGTVFAKDQWQFRKLKKGLEQELEDIADQMRRVELIYTGHLQVFAANGIDPSSTIPIPNHFFKHHYKDIFSRLNHSQRLSYQLIHASLELFNAQNEAFIKFTEEAYRKHLESKDKGTPELQMALKLWGDQVKVLYMNVKNILWHIEYHLEHREDPAFDVMGPMHDAYLKHEQETKQQIEIILEKAKTLKRQDFEKI